MRTDFFRKDDYSKVSLQSARDLEEEFDGKLVSIPNVDGIYCYYNGLRFISIKANSIEPFSKSKSKDPKKSEYKNKRNAIREQILAEKSIEGRIKKYRDKKTDIEDIMENSMTQDHLTRMHSLSVAWRQQWQVDIYQLSRMEKESELRWIWS